MIPLFAASCCFGTMAVLVRLAARQMTALEITWVRFAGSLVVLLVATRGRELWPQRAPIRTLALRGVLGAAAIACYFVGIARAGAGLATLLHSTYPVWTALWGVVFLDEVLTGRLVAALALSIAGAAVVLWDQLGGSGGSVVGAGFALLGGLLAGGAVVTAGELRRWESASLITIWFMAIGALLTAPALVGGIARPAPALAVTLLGVIGSSALGQWLLHHGLGFVPPTVGSLAGATGVVTAAVLEGLVLGDGVGPAVIAGGTLMMAAVGLAIGGRRPAYPDAVAASEIEPLVGR